MNKLTCLLLAPFALSPLVHAAEPVWLSEQPVPKAAELSELKGVRFHVIKANEPAKDGYKWMKGVALAWHKGKLFASFGHNKGAENTSGEEARGRISGDGGKTWGEVFTIATPDDPELGISHGVFLSRGGELWAFHGAFHGNKLTDTELDLLAEAGASFTTTPEVEMQMGHGIPPIQRSLDFGIRPSLSVDVETNQPTDMFTQMRACFMLQRGLLNANNLFPETAHVPQLLTARDVLEFATIEGARTNGLGDKVGSVTPGKQADLVLLNARALNVAPVNDPVGAVVLGRDTSNVDSVFVEGRPLKWQGNLVGVNLERLLDRAEAMQVALYERAGFTPPRS